MTLPGSWVSAADFFIKFHASNTLLNSVEYTITRKDSFLVQKSCLNTATVVYPKQHYQKVVSSCEAEFLEKIRMKVLRVFFLVIHSQLYSFAWDFYFFKLTQPLTVSVKEKGGRPDKKPYPLPYGLRNPYRNLKPENSQDYGDYGQQLQRDCKFMNSASVHSSWEDSETLDVSPLPSSLLCGKSRKIPKVKKKKTVGKWLLHHPPLGIGPFSR